jgi:hypothetical protein
MLVGNITEFRGWEIYNFCTYHLVSKANSGYYVQKHFSSAEEAKDYIRQNTRKMWLLVEGMFEGQPLAFEDCFVSLDDGWTDEQVVEYIKNWGDFDGLPFKVMTPQDLLNSLEDERANPKPNPMYMGNVIDSLIDLGVYPDPTPAMQKYGYSYLDMVDNYGANWHEWKGLLSCPCGADFRDLENGPPFKREIGVEIQGFYDGVLYYECPDCHGKLPRPGFEELLAKYEKSRVNL